MQGSGEKLTIAEFAARAGCTTQRIYQLLHNSLQPFAIEENGRKYILSDGIEVVTAARKKQGFTKSLQEDLPTVGKGLQEAPNNEEQAKIEELTAELNELRAALDAIKPQAAALIIDNDRLKQDLEKTVLETVYHWQHRVPLAHAWREGLPLKIFSLRRKGRKE